MMSMGMVGSVSTSVCCPLYKGQMDYVMVFGLIGNILAVRASQPPHGGCVAIAVGGAATPFSYKYLYFQFLRGLFPRP